MPMRSRARLGTQSRQQARSIGWPNSGFRKMEKPAWRLGPAASQQPHTKPRPCKHCAASARRRSCVSSLWFLFAEFLEARIATQRIKHRIEPEQRGSERDAGGKTASARYRKYFL